MVDALKNANAYTRKVATFLFALAVMGYTQAAVAGTSSGSSIQFGLQDALNEILAFIQGPIVFTIISIAIIGGIMMMVVKSQRGESVSKLAVPVIGGLALLNIDTILEPLGITASAIM